LATLEKNSIEEFLIKSYRLLTFSHFSPLRRFSTM
jgi:hypothetical protein